MKECHWIAYHLILSRKYRGMALNVKIDEMLYKLQAQTIAFKFSSELLPLIYGLSAALLF